MTATTTLDQILTVASVAGIELERVNDSSQFSNLYCWVSEEGEALYIGKDNNGTRWKNEQRWKGSIYRDNINHAGFCMLVNENGADIQRLLYRPESFDSNAILNIMNEYGWEGSAINKVRQRLESGSIPTLEEIETILIRIPIRMGKIIGNSKDASQWENPVGNFTDAIAYLAVDSMWNTGALHSRCIVDE